MNFYDLYDKVCVKINCIDSVGSGVLFQPDSDQYSYVLTAKHCLTGTEDTLQEFTSKNISVKRHEEEGNWTEYTVKDYKVHPRADIAVIIVEKKCDFEAPITVEKEYKNAVTICGYPKEQEKKENPKEIINGHITAVHRNKLEIRMDAPMATFYHGDDVYIKGFSGSGIFIETEQRKLALVGIFTGVKHVEVAYGALVGESLEQVNEMLQDTEYPLLTEPYPEYMVKKLSAKYKYLFEWQLNQRLNSSPWVEFDRSRDLLKDIQNHFFSTDEVNVLHIVGRSGIGKTRSILRACQEEEKLNTVLYFDSYLSLEDSFKEFIKHSSSSYKFVIDDISLEEWEKLNSEFSIFSERIRIVTIGVAPEYKLASREGLRIIFPPTNDDVIRLMQQTDPSLSEDDCKYLAGLCEKDLRLVMLLLGANKKGPMEIGPMSTVGTRFYSIDSLVDRILNQFEKEIGDIPTFKKYYSKLCLLVDIGIKGTYREEIKYVSNYFGLNLNEMDGFIEKANNCWLGIIRVEFFEALPRALARLFFEKEGWALVKQDLSNFINNMPTHQMQKRFINRIEECGVAFREEAKAELSAWFLETFPRYDLKLIDDVEKSKIFKVYTEFSPETGLNWLKNSVAEANPEELLTFKGSGGFFGANKSRRYIVWLCEHLACFKEYFWDCEEILFRLSQYETEIHISNNSQGIWTGLFVPVLSNTEIPFKHRYELLMKRLTQANNDNIDFILKAITPIFSNQYTKMVPPKIIGGRVVPEEWKPSSFEELTELKQWAISVFIKIINSLESEIAKKAIDYLVEEISTFINFGFLSELKQIFKLRASDMQLRKLKYNLEEYISRIEKYHFDSSYLLDAIEWESQLTANSIEARLSEFIFRNYWSHYHSTDEQTVEQETSELAREVIGRNINLFDFISEFESEECDTTSLMKLAEKISFFDKKEKYKDYVLGLVRENKLTEFVIAYFHGIQIRLKSLPKWCTEILDEYESIHPQSILSVTITCDMTKTGFNRILRLIESTKDISYHLFKMYYKEWEELLTEQEKITLFNTIVRFTPDKNAMQVILRLISMWNHGKYKEKISDDMSEVLLVVLKKCLTDNFLFDDWHWNETIKLISSKFEKETCQLLTMALIYPPSGHSQLENYALSNLIQLAKNNCSQIIMNYLGELMLHEKHSYNFLLHVYRGLFEAIDLNVVKVWVKKNGVAAARVIARHIASPVPTEDNPVFIPPLTEWLLTEYETDDRSFKEFLAGRHSFEVFNIESTIAEHEQLVSAMQPYLHHSLRRIREWAEFEIRNSDSIRKEHEIMKAREEREWK